jgi:hypothetical protein
MMVIFTRKNIEHWSNFSGDSNKLHYTTLQGNGIVQGMLIFVFLLNKIITFNSAKKDVSKFEAFFRREVYADITIKVSDFNGNKIFIENMAKDKLITAQMICNSKEFAKINATGMEHIRIGKERLEKYLMGFYSVFPESSSELVFYSALCFSVGLGSKTFLTHKDYTFQVSEGYFDSYIIKHISQAIEWPGPFHHAKLVDINESSIDILIKEDSIVDLSPYTVARTIVYILKVDGIEHLRMKSVFLTDVINRITNEYDFS